MTSSVFSLCYGQRALEKAPTARQTMQTITAALHRMYTIFPLII